MKVLKFGGTSVGKPERMRAVGELVQNTPGKRIVVLSALSQTTNALVGISGALFKGRKASALEQIQGLHQHYEHYIQDLFNTPQSLEVGRQIIQEHFKTIEVLVDSAPFGINEEKIILAQGELMSTKFFHAYLQEQGVEAVLIPALRFMRIDASGEPKIAEIRQALNQELKEYPNQEIFITQGYISLNHRDQIDNLQRGGSDYTASLIGSALKAKEIQIWTDIDGMHNADPRLVPNTRPVAELSFEEAAELAYFGAKILHPASIHPAREYDIPVRLLNTMKPEATGTIIKSLYGQQQDAVKSIAAKDGIIAIKIKSTRMLMAYGFLRKIFEIFESYQTSIDVITTSEVAVSLSIDSDKHLEEISRELLKFGTVEIDREQSIICIVGDFVAERLGTAAKVFNSLQDIPIRMISFGGSKHNISILVNSSDRDRAMNLLHQGLFSDKTG